MRVKTEARRLAIVAAAWEIFCETGYDRTTMSAIAERIGGSKGTLYGYFRSKEELLIAAVTQAFAERGDAAFRYLETSEPLSVRLTNFARAYVAMRCDRDSIALVRIIVADAGRSNIGELLQDQVVSTQWKRLAKYLKAEADAGVLKCEDTEAAVDDFCSLLSWPVFERCLVSGAGFEDEEISRLASRSVQTFLRIYGAA